MTAKLKPANDKAWQLLAKLQALAERGVDGEKLSALDKIARLRARFDFSGAPADPMPDLFAGQFKRAEKAHWVFTFGATDSEVPNCVKWAIEKATGIRCVWQNGDLLAEATPPTARRLTQIAVEIAGSFQALLAQFGGVAGVTRQDQVVFVMGLYDGMMNEPRAMGQRLPGRAAPKPTRKSKAGAAPVAPGLHVHPYTVGLGLGRQIRFSVPLGQITAELEAIVQKQLPTP